MIDVQHASKRYGKIEAVKDISFQVEKGSLFAFLGTNGAGKSTTISMLTTLVEPTSGVIKINGMEVNSVKAMHEVRKQIGIVYQKSILDDALTVYENIRYRAMLYDLDKQTFEQNYAFVKEKLHLADIEHHKYGKLSGGQRRRADIARALIHRPVILFLDEPTTGLDPHTRQFVWETIDNLRKEVGMTIFLTTHYMEEAAVADKIVIIKAGEIIAQGTPQQLKAAFAKDTVRLFAKEEQAMQLILQRLPAVQQKNALVAEMYIDDTFAALQVIELVKNELHSFEVIKGSLDDVFIQLNR